MGTILVKSAINALQIEVFKKFIEEIQFSGTFFVIDTFFANFEFDLRVIFDQWPKLHLGLDVRPEIPILRIIYYICITIYDIYL